MTTAVTVVANCHCLPLADALALCCPELDTDFVDVNNLAAPEMANKISALPLQRPLVFSQPISQAHGGAGTAALRQAVGSDRVLTFTNVHFTGLHPDITYLGTMGNRVQSFFGDYHSKLILFSYVTRRSRTDCRALFTAETYRRIGYLSAYEESAAELRRRESACDIRFAETFLGMLQREPCLLTVNHLTPSVFLAFAEALARHAGFRFHNMAPVFALNHLAASFIWPVYEEIAEHNGLHYRSPPFFVTSARRQSRSFTLDEFIAGCYASYASSDIATLSDVVLRHPFYQDFARQLGV